MSLEDPIANPSYADPQLLSNLPPISLHVGSAELLLSDSVMMAQRVAAAGRPVEIHQYDGMWHVFPMYADEAGSGEPLVLARSAFSATNTFLAGVAARKTFKQSSTPFFYGHYEYPLGRDIAAGLSPFTDTP